MNKDMIQLNFDSLQKETLLNLSEIAERTGIKYPALVAMKKRGTVKRSVARKIKTKLSLDIERYIVTSN